MNNFNCPIPHYQEDVITLSHGSGGKQTSDLIENIFLSPFSSEEIKK
ncbi:MAG: hydrogenase expression/formation protein HypE, partial [Chlamydiae bacterium]|nr:hydrogenase expression/formation protein HypE [Chlamydiota bacterium]